MAGSNVLRESAKKVGRYFTRYPKQFQGGEEYIGFTFLLRRINEKIINKNTRVQSTVFVLLAQKRCIIILGEGYMASFTQQASYSGNTNCEKINNEEQREYIAEIGVKYGCVLSQILFTTMVDEAAKEYEMMKRIRKTQVSELIFADVMVIIANSVENL